MFTSASINFCYIIVHRSCCNAAQINLNYPLLEVKCIRLCERLNWPLPSSLAVFAGASSALDFSGSTASLTLREIKGWYEKHLQPPTPPCLHPLLPPATSRDLSQPHLSCISPHPAAAPSVLCLFIKIEIGQRCKPSPEIVCSVFPSSLPPS